MQQSKVAFQVTAIENILENEHGQCNTLLNEAPLDNCFVCIDFQLIDIEWFISGFTVQY